MIAENWFENSFWWTVSTRWQRGGENPQLDFEIQKKRGLNCVNGKSSILQNEKKSIFSKIGGNGTRREDREEKEGVLGKNTVMTRASLSLSS